MNFLKGMFSDEAEVDKFPNESQRLTTESRMGGDDAAAEAGLLPAEQQEQLQGEQGLGVSPEQQQPLEQSGGETDDDHNESSPGLTDGYQTWSQSFAAFHQGIFHSMAYLVIGTVAYSYLLDTKWPVVDSLYFSVVLFTTVGYGDLSPAATRQGQIFTMFFAFYGVVIIGIFLGVMGDLIVERQQKHRKTTMESARRKYLETFQHGTYNGGRHPPSPAEAQGNSSWLAHVVQLYCKIVQEEFWALVLLIAIAIPVILIEKWDIVKGLYWMVITGTTVGLGDESPQQPISRALCILYIPVAVYATGRFLGLIASSFVERRDHAMEEKFLSRAMTLSDIERMDLDSDGGVDQSEFLIYMLVTLQKVEEEDIEEILTLFHKLDKTGDGVLTIDDLQQGIKRAGKLAASYNRDASLRGDQVL